MLSIHGPTAIVSSSLLSSEDLRCELWSSRAIAIGVGWVVGVVGRSWPEGREIRAEPPAVRLFVEAGGCYNTSASSPLPTSPARRAEGLLGVPQDAVGNVDSGLRFQNITAIGFGFYYRNLNTNIFYGCQNMCF